MPNDPTHGRRDAPGLMMRLGRDRRGSTLGIVAGALVPLLAMVGGGIDVSRLYMARTRLQQACDAGALAGRRTMADPSTFTAADNQVAQRFFDFDFPAATYLATNVTKSFARGEFPGSVRGTASIVMPTTIMKFFGFGTLPMTVNCESTLVIPNTDIMFVLDVTGSMAETPAGDTQNRIASLRQAVKDFYVALGPGAPAGPGRIRYGFVPYSSNVNVGRLVMAENASWIAGGAGTENANYQSRRPAPTTTKYDPNYGAESARTNGTPTETAKAFGGYSGYTTHNNQTLAQCQARGVDEDKLVSSSNPTLTADENPPTHPDAVRDRSYSTVERRSYRDWEAVHDAAAKTCTTRFRDGTFQRTIPSTTKTPVTWTPYQEFTSWQYGRTSIDVAPFLDGTAPNPAFWNGRFDTTKPNPNIWDQDDNPATANEMTPSTVDWNGCIEEASTVNNIRASSSLQPPAGANDLNIDLIPNSTATRWKPYLPQLQYLLQFDWYWRAQVRAGGLSACPREAARLAMYTTDVNPTTRLSTSFGNYVDSLQPIGGTYHDIGLIWGARFLSPDGIFRAANANTAAPGQFPVDRHIVFMTDGALSTSFRSNDPWGINILDGHVAPTNSNDDRMNETHLRRTSIICEQMRGKGYTVWVVGFGITTMPAELQACARSADHWSLSQNSAQLRARFQQIAQLIGGLRLTQ